MTSKEDKTVSSLRRFHTACNSWFSSAHVTAGESWRTVILCLQSCLSGALVAHRLRRFRAGWGREPHLKTSLATFFVQIQWHSHGLTKAAVVNEEQIHLKATSITVSVLYTGLSCLQYMVAWLHPEICCHLLRLWASCFKSRVVSFCLHEICLQEMSHTGDTKWSVLWIQSGQSKKFFSVFP